jgi:hypothetical protein
MSLGFARAGNSAQVVGHPIVAAAGLQPGPRIWPTKTAHINHIYAPGSFHDRAGPRDPVSPLERRLQGRIACPTTNAEMPHLAKLSEFRLTTRQADYQSAAGWQPAPQNIGAAREESGMSEYKKGFSSCLAALTIYPAQSDPPLLSLPLNSP